MEKILIIGGGVSGLSAGIYSGLRGYDTIICERHTRAGGNLTGWQRGEYHIDNCIHWLTGTNPMTDTYKMWCELGVLGNVEIYQSDTLYTCERDGERLSLDRSIDKTEKDMLTLSPIDKKEILSFTSAVRAVQGISGTAGEHRNKRIGIPSLIISAPNILKYHFLSTGELSRRFKHPLIRDLIVSVLGEYFSALALIIVFATFSGENGGIPKGSSVAMAERMTEKFASLGGKLLLGKEAVRINGIGTKAKSVSFSDGSEIAADYIVLATDPEICYGQLLERDMPPQFKKMYENPKMLRFSSYHTAFACDMEALPFKGDFVFEIPNSAKRFLHTKYLIMREFSHEPGFSPKGKNIIQTMTFSDESCSERFIKLYSERAAYEATKKRVVEAIHDLIISKFPELSGRLECIDVWTPATYRRYTGASIGSYMSFVLPPRKIPCPVSCESGVYDNVLLATQWQNPPGGLPIAADMGREVIEKIAQKIRGRI